MAWQETMVVLLGRLYVSVRVGFFSIFFFFFFMTAKVSLP